MDTQQILTNLGGALIFAIPLAARAWARRATADAKIKETVADQVGLLEKRLAAAEARAAAAEAREATTAALNVEQAKRIEALHRQTSADNELIAAFSEQKTTDDKVIEGLQKDNAELNRIISTGRN